VVPPLRERSEDIPKLAKYLLEQLSASHGYQSVKLSEDALNYLLSYQFPGNIRELENILERAITLSMGEEIQPLDLNIKNAMKPTCSTLDNAVSSLEITARGDLSLDEYLEGIESNEIAIALEKSKGNKTQAAKLLGISFRAMRYKLKKLEID